MSNGVLKVLQDHLVVMQGGADHTALKLAIREIATLHAENAELRAFINKYSKIMARVSLSITKEMGKGPMEIDRAWVAAEMMVLESGAEHMRTALSKSLPVTAEGGGA